MANLRANKITTGTVDYQGSIYASGVGAFLRTKTTAPGTDDFTIECWLNSNDASDSTQEGVFAINGDADGFQSGTSNQIRLVQGRYGGGGTNGGLEVDINGTDVGTGNGNDIIQEGTWYHVAVTRASGTVKIWVDGVEKASGSAAGDVTGTTFITGYYDDGYTYQGYMSNFRYRKGTAYYTATFTAPTRALERTSDSELIFAQSANNTGDGYSSALFGGTTNIMQVNGNVSANTSAPTLTTTSDDGVVFGGDPKFNTQGAMYFPTGETTQRGRGRAVFAGGEIYGSPASVKVNTIAYLQIQSMGVGGDFGDMTTAASTGGGVSSSVRAVFPQYNTPTIPGNTIEYVTIATTGNATDFGDNIVACSQEASASNDTRGIIAGGLISPSTAQNFMDYITIATTGNATDFGDLPKTIASGAACASSTRWIMGGGIGPASPWPNLVDVNYVTIATTGNAADFGDLTVGRRAPSACASSTRGVFAAGTSPNADNVIDYVTIASAGNAADFGDLVAARAWGGGTSNSSRGIFFGNTAPTFTNAAEYITIATTGNAADWGDAIYAPQEMGGTSDSHGGLS